MTEKKGVRWHQLACLVFRAYLIIGLDPYVVAGVGGGSGEGNEGPALCFCISLLAVLGLCCCSGLAAVSGVYSGCGATHCGSFSCCGARALGHTDFSS